MFRAKNATDQPFFPKTKPTVTKNENNNRKGKENKIKNKICNQKSTGKED